MRRQPIRELTTLSAIVTLYLCIGVTTGRTIDQIIANAYSPAASSDILSDSAGGAVLHELDMMLTLEQYTALYINQSEMNLLSPGKYLRQKRKAFKPLYSRWTNNQIPYRIQSADFSRRDITEINNAIDEWQRYTCISFKTATSQDSNFVNFQDGSGCSSYIGMIKGQQAISLANGCRYKGTVVHEIGHAVGFFHEQNRPDRDDYIIIKKENILHPDLYSNFVKQPSSAVSTFDVPYDYTSVLHYGGTAFSGNGQNTIVTINPAYQNVIGNREGLSFNDIKLANLMYNCNDHCRSSTACPKEGFLGKDCKCWCPGNPVSECGQSTQRPVARTTLEPAVRTTPRPTVHPTSQPAVCTDMNQNCPSWAKSGYCRNSYYVKTYCKASCSMCSSPIKPVPICMDIGEHCKYWSNQGYCKHTYTFFMSKNCRETCGHCTAFKNSIMVSNKITTDNTNTNEIKSDNMNDENDAVNILSSSLLTLCFACLNILIILF